MTIHYVDSSVAASGDGTSWASAWKDITNITGVAAGDIVYFSGGPSGGAGLTYTLPSGGWIPAGGSAGNPIKYQIGQDSAHNGLVIFTGAGNFLNGSAGPAVSYVTISGQVSSDPPFVLGLNPSPNQHIQVGSLGTPATLATMDCNNSVGLTISYVNFGQKSRSMFSANPAQSLQFDHCYYYKLTDVNDDSVIWIDMPTTLGFDDSKISFNTIYSPYSTATDGWGDDVIGATNYSGLSVHDNIIIGYGVANYLAQQHQDAWQLLSANNVKYYNNYVANLSNYGFFVGAYYGGANHVYCFNNIIAITDSVLQSFNSPAGISIFADGGASSWPFQNIIVAHNIICDYGGQRATRFGDQGAGTVIWQGNTGMWNNIATNNTAFPTAFTDQGNANVANVNNPTVTTPDGAGYFVRYVKDAVSWGNFDLHLLASAVSLIGQGTNLSANAALCPEIMYDRGGVQRPMTGPWDIGPYQYVSVPSGGGGGGTPPNGGGGGGGSGQGGGITPPSKAHVAESYVTGYPPPAHSRTHPVKSFIDCWPAPAIPSPRARCKSYVDGYPPSAQPPNS